MVPFPLADSVKSIGSNGDRVTVGMGDFVVCWLVAFCLMLALAGASQFRTYPSGALIRAHSVSMPQPRGPFTEQQFSSGVPWRDWKTIEWAEASRTPSIGVL